MDTGPSELLDFNDFESIVLTIHIENLVTGMKCDQGCALIELGDRALTLSLPPGACRQENKILIDIYKGELIFARGISPLFRATAKVTGIETLEDTTIFANVNLVQFDEKGWQDLNALFQDRQNTINRFFEEAGDKRG